jgi:hypothetical protein
MKSMRMLGMLLAAVLLAACMDDKPTVEVWKSASCGCCKDWVRYLEANGFNVHAHDVDEPAAYRNKLGIPDQFGSCHTAAIGGYALEGHVPECSRSRGARDADRLARNGWTRIQGPNGSL